MSVAHGRQRAQPLRPANHGAYRARQHAPWFEGAQTRSRSRSVLGGLEFGNEIAPSFSVDRVRRKLLECSVEHLNRFARSALRFDGESKGRREHRAIWARRKIIFDRLRETCTHHRLGLFRPTGEGQRRRLGNTADHHNGVTLSKVARQQFKGSIDCCDRFVVSEQPVATASLTTTTVSLSGSFLAGLLAETPCSGADFAPAFDRFDFGDVVAFLQIFGAGCP